MSMVVGMTEEDIYGQRHPIECPELIAASKIELEPLELDEVPVSKTRMDQGKNKVSRHGER